jgi:CBS domain-containing protein
LKEVTYSKDELPYRREVTKFKGVNIIMEGEYESFFYDNSEIKRAIELFETGHFYSGVSVLLNHKKSLKSTLVKKRAETYFLYRRDFRALYDVYEEFSPYFTTEFGRKMLNEEFVYLNRKSASFEESYTAS